MEKLLIERTVVARVAIGRQPDFQRRGLDKRRIPQVDPLRRIRVGLYASRAQRGRPLFR